MLALLSRLRRQRALIALAPDYDTLAPASAPDVRVYNGDLIVRIMPSSTSVASSFTLADGTRLVWDGSLLRIEANAQPRNVELRLPDGRSVQQRVDTGSSTLAPA